MDQNLAGKPTEREELPFLYKNLEPLSFKIFARGPKLGKYEFLRQSEKFSLLNFRG